MRKLRSLLAWVVVFGLLAGTEIWAVSGEDFEYKGYFRAGSGSNVQGGDQYCFNQSGIPGNEFRLANECSIYGEAYLIGHLVKPKPAAPAFFDSHVAFAYSPPGHTQYEDPKMNLIEAWASAGHLSGSPLSYWVGKRFYREPQLYMHDFFYFADSSGNGGGVEGIPVLGGHLDIALMTEAGTVTTNVGLSRIIMLDVRLFEVPISNSDKLYFWGGVSMSSGGVDSKGVRYDDGRGGVFGIKHGHQFGATGGSQTFAVVAGQGLLQGMNLGGNFGGNPSPIAGLSTQAKAWRFRVIEDLMLTPLRQFAVEFGAVYENWNTGATQGGNGHWMTLGVRPIYFFNEYFSVAVEVGASTVTNPGAGTTQLMRATIAPQIMPKMDFFARPALRAFLTDTFGKGVSYGLQTEVWF